MVKPGRRKRVEGISRNLHPISKLPTAIKVIRPHFSPDPGPVPGGESALQEAPRRTFKHEPRTGGSRSGLPERILAVKVSFMRCYSNLSYPTLDEHGGVFFFILIKACRWLSPYPRVLDQRLLWSNTMPSCLHRLLMSFWGRMTVVM